MYRLFFARLVAGLVVAVGLGALGVQADEEIKIELPEPYYGVLDSLGIKLLQGVRPEWAAEVCPPRAHHPSIVAWVAPQGALESLRRIVPERGAGGRPWLAREAVFAS